MQIGKSMLLRPSPWKWIGIGLICLVFVVIGFFMARGNEPFWGWANMIFFGLGLLVSIAARLPNASYLKLDSEGFTMCSLYRKHTFRWRDVRDFTVGYVSVNKMVLFDFEPSYKQSAILRSINVDLSGAEAGLPDNYGMKYEELAELMNRYKAASKLQN
jgi:hypothetical protein